jgi:hypothetical protein
VAVHPISFTLEISWMGRLKRGLARENGLKHTSLEFRGREP